GRVLAGGRGDAARAGRGARPRARVPAAMQHGGDLSMRLARTLEATLGLAVREARRRRHEFLTIEHVLWALLHDEAVAEAIRACGGRVPALVEELESYLEEHIESLPPDDDRPPQQTVGFQRVLQRAAAHVQSAGRDEIDGRDLLAAIF